MSVEVINEVTTTTLTSTSDPFIHKAHYKTLRGALQLTEVILGAVCVGIVAFNISIYRNTYHYIGELFFILMVTTFLIASTCLYLSCAFSLSTAIAIVKTLHELVYHAVASLLVLAASLNLIIEVHSHKSDYLRRYEPYLVASVIGLVNAVLYLVSAVYGYISFRSM